MSNLIYFGLQLSECSYLILWNKYFQIWPGFIPIFFSYSLFVFVFAIIGANFPEARVRRNSSPQPPPSAAPERISERFAKVRQQFRSKWVRAKFRIRD